MGRRSMTVGMKYIHRFTDRHGHDRFYFRKDGRRCALKGKPGSPEFIASYTEAQATLTDAPRPLRIVPDKGTFAALAALYFASANYQALSPSSRMNYRRIIEGFLREPRQPLAYERLMDLALCSRSRWAAVALALFVWMAEVKMTKDDFMSMMWADFLRWAYSEKDIRERFEAATGRRLSLPPSSPLDAAIDKATGKDESDAFEFAKWATINLWGIDEAPASFRDAITPPPPQPTASSPEDSSPR